MSAKVVDSYVKRGWAFSFNIEPGSAPDMPPWEGSRQMMRPTSLKLVIETFPDKPTPKVVTMTTWGPQVLKDGTLSQANIKQAHIWAYRGVPAWVAELSQGALELAEAEYEHRRFEGL